MSNEIDARKQFSNFIKELTSHIQSDYVKAHLGQALQKFDACTAARVTERRKDVVGTGEAF